MAAALCSSRMGFVSVCSAGKVSIYAGRVSDGKGMIIFATQPVEYTSISNEVQRCQARFFYACPSGTQVPRPETLAHS